MKSLTETQNTDSKKNLVNIVKGIVISYLLTFVLLFIFSIVLTYTNIGESTIAPVIIVLTMISILIGSSTSSMKIKKNGILNGGVIGFVYIAILYLISSMVQTGFGINAYTIVMIVLSILSGMIGGIVGVNLKK